METVPTPELVASPMTVKKRCPLDGSLLYYEQQDDLMGWGCHLCEYFEPDLI